jgi:uncharacterized protein YkwD
MTLTNQPTARALVLGALSALCLSGLNGAQAAQAADCSGADLTPAASNLPQVSAGMLCLLNAQRSDAGIRPLSASTVLTTVSTRYSQRMVSEHFFGHTAPDGTTFPRRLSAIGYRRPNGRSVGENIGWGQDTLSSARSMVAAWMNSPGHRAVILTATYREIGIGIAMGAPVDQSLGATYTADFGAGASARRAKTWAATRRHPTRTG